jgi:K319L-like, PKD domain
MTKRRNAALAVLALAAAAVFVLPASSASAGSATTPNACANSVTANFSQIDVTTSGDDGLTTVTPAGATTTTGLSQQAAIPGAIFVAGYNLGLLVVGPNNIPANVRTTIEATNTAQGQQLTNVVGGSPPNGTVTVSTTISDPDGTPGTGDETATPASFDVTYNNLSWTASGPDGSTIDYRQQSIAALPLSTTNNTLLINALVGGVFNVQFRCTPGTVTPPDPGIITLIDPAGSFDTTAIEAPNVAPTANAGADQTVASGALVNLDGTGSSDPDGTIASYAWTQTGGPAVTLTGADTATPSFTAPTVAVSTDLTFSLTVTDNDGATGTDTVVVTVNPPNVAPTANAGADQTVTAGDLVTLDGTGSSDPNGDALTFSWTQLSGTTVTLSGANTATPSFTAPNVTETLVFQLEVCDPAPLCATDTVSVNVTQPITDASGVVIVNGPVSSTKTSKSFVFKVTNTGMTPITINESNITSSVDVNGLLTGSVAVNPFTKTLNPGASTRVKLVWSYAAGSLVTGDAVTFEACVTVAGDSDTTNDCDTQTATAK